MRVRAAPDLYPIDLHSRFVQTRLLSLVFYAVEPTRGLPSRDSSKDQRSDRSPSESMPCAPPAFRRTLSLDDRFLSNHRPQKCVNRIPAMNSLRFPRILRVFTGLTLATTLALLGGCLQKHIVWSPDGQRAAIISADGLRLCTADGTLSEQLTPGVYRVAWLGDSQRLVVVRERPAADWTDVTRALGTERSQQAVTEAEAVWSKLQAGALWSAVATDFSRKKALPFFHLREMHGPQLRAKLTAEEWAVLAALEIKRHEVVLLGQQPSPADPAKPIFTDVEMIADLRIAPGETAVALTVTTDSGKGDHFRLVVAPLDGSAPATAVATEVASFPDWTADRRSLVFLQAAGASEQDFAQLGVLQQREVLAADGKIALAAKATDLGGALFQAMCRIRCLPDGRIVFNAAELNLPVAACDLEADREQLFVLDPTRQATLVRLLPRGEKEKLPKMLGFFEPSSDGKTLLIGGVDGEVCLFTLATGEIVRVQGEAKEMLCQPAWRGPGEFSYLKPTESPGKAPPSRKFEVVLRQGDKETVLSKTWPDAVLEGVGK